MEGSDQVSERLISVSAVVLRCPEGSRVGAAAGRDDGPILTVRKVGTERFMLPGGKWEPGETPLECAVREIHEELGVELAASLIAPLGRFDTATANEPGFRLISEVFAATLTSGAPEPRAQAEIAELRWVKPGDLAALDESQCAPWAPLLVRVCREELLASPTSR